MSGDDAWVSGLTILWWDGTTYRGGEFHNTTYYNMRGTRFEGNWVPDARYLNLGKPEDAGSYGFSDQVWFKSSLTPVQRQTAELRIWESNGSKAYIRNLPPEEAQLVWTLEAERAENFDRFAAPQWHEPKGAVRLDAFARMVTGRSVTDYGETQVTAQSLTSMGEEAGRPIFALGAEDYSETMRFGYSDDLERMLWQQGLLELVGLTEPRNGGRTTHALVGPVGTDKIVTFFPLGLAALRDGENWSYKVYDLDFRRITRGARTAQKLFKAVHGGPTHFRVWKNHYQEWFLAVEERSENPDIRAHASYDGINGDPSYRDEVGLMTHAQLRTFVREQGIDPRTSQPRVKVVELI